MKKNNDGFSVALGLTDYINPILYAITCYTLYNNLIMNNPYNRLFLLGTILSLIFGLVIPTGKLIVGLGIIKFRMPVILVLLVNSGIFITSISLFKTIINPSNYILITIVLLSFILLSFLYYKSRKFNSLAVLIGAVGYLLIYISLIVKSVQMKYSIPIILYIVAICLFLSLIRIGIKSNLKDSKIHWKIEIFNVICQACVTIGTIILFK